MLIGCGTHPQLDNESTAIHPVKSTSIGAVLAKEYKPLTQLGITYKHDANDQQQSNIANTFAQRYILLNIEWHKGVLNLKLY